MIRSLIRYLKGYVRIRVTGSSYERFLNMCGNHKFVLWNLKAVDHAYEMNLSIQEFRMLRPLAKKSGTRVRIIKRYGLPFFLHRYRHRKLLFAGMAFGITLMLYLSGFIWQIQVAGNHMETDDVIFDFLESQKITHGIRKSGIDCRALAAKLRRAFDDFTWVSVKIEGTRLLIDVQENTDKNFCQESKAAACDLISNVNGTVVSIMTRSGTAQVKSGDHVQKGQPLVLGKIDILNDEGEVAASRYCAADADIYVQTAYYFCYRFPLRYQERIYSGREKKKYFFRVGPVGLKIPHGKISYAAYDTVTKEHQMRLFEHFYLPVYWGKTENREYRIAENTYSKEEAVRKTKTILRKFLYKIQEKGVQILKNNVKIEVCNKNCLAKGEIYFIEKAGKRQERNIGE